MTRIFAELLAQVPPPEPRNPKPETRNPKPETRNPKPETHHSHPCASRHAPPRLSPPLPPLPLPHRPPPPAQLVSGMVALASGCRGGCGRLPGFRVEGFRVGLGFRARFRACGAFFLVWRGWACQVDGKRFGLGKCSSSFCGSVACRREGSGLEPSHPPDTEGGQSEKPGSSLRLTPTHPHRTSVCQERRECRRLCRREGSGFP